jgi:hypothetical protein
MPFFNDDASVIMSAQKKLTPVYPGTDRQPDLKPDCLERARSLDTAPVWARSERDAAGETRRSNRGIPD